jgi:prolyl 4-hydroxylase
MSLFAQAVALGRAGRPAEGVALIERAAAAGDAEGNLILAHWHLYGSDRPRDVAAARACLQKSAEKGGTEAVRILANLTAAGTGGEADWDTAVGLLRQIAGADPIAAEQLRLLPHAMCDEDAARVDLEVLSADPRIEVGRRLLSAEECAYLMRRAEPLLKPSLVDDPATGVLGRPDPIRTSHGAAFVPHDEDLLIQRINRRLAIATGTGVEQREPLYVMRYTPGQQYRLHHDALAGLKVQRAMTAITYLNENYEGGATVFPDLSISIRGGTGDVLIFQNIDAAGGPHPLMRHAGEPVTRGAKWVATRWIRSASHDPYARG